MENFIPNNNTIKDKNILDLTADDLVSTEQEIWDQKMTTVLSIIRGTHRLGKRTTDIKSGGCLIQEDLPEVQRRLELKKFKVTPTNKYSNSTRDQYLKVEW